MTPLRSALRVVISLALTLSIRPAFATEHGPAAVFAKKCSGCHTYGRGDRVGPDLKGVTDRRTRAWLTAWIRSSQQLVAGRDRTALALFEKFKRERMPDQTLSDQDIAALLDYFAAGGPLASNSGRARHAATAAPAEIAAGRNLFFGATRARSGGASCSSCHSVRVRQASAGGTFAADLTHVYSRFQDASFTEFLRRPCFPRAFTAPGSAPLTEDEAFKIKAFLFYADHGDPVGRGASGR